MYGETLREFAAAAQDDLGQLIAAASARLMKDAFERLSALGYPEVHPAHIAVFTGLDPEGTRVSVLAERAGISRQAMSVLVRGLEQSGYLSTQADPSDQRATLVRLDARGAAFCDAAIAIARELDGEIAKRLAPGRMQLLKETLRSLGE
ncbi:MarR family winged helix-turn-helix transcriptional regulator [Microbacterium sp. NPDC056052]|uniref:MarR family winged helix-turn-helix transcriptional regulator n=1 Tax=Microbacterium sp. NPDC056052 TaxID=3345695 RepID=UPI0035DBF9D5